MMPLFLLLSLAAISPAAEPLPDGAVRAARIGPPLPPPFPHALHAEAIALLMNRFDADHNGSLDDEELFRLRSFAEQLFEKKKKAILARYDRNGDGKLDGDEQAAFRQDWERAHPRIGRLARQKEREERRTMRLLRLRRFDGNGDGSLDENELSAMRQWVEQNKRGQKCTRRDPVVNSGTSPARSAENPPPPVIPAERARPLPPEAGIVLEYLLLERYDSDGDGFLSAQEIEVALDAHGSQRVLAPSIKTLPRDEEAERKESGLDERR